MRESPIAGASPLALARRRAMLPETWAPFACLGLGIVAWVLLFREEAAAAVGVWRDSTAYNHCFLVVPIAAYLIWDRRRELAGFMPAPSLKLALLALPVSLVWFAAERLGIMEARQLAAITGLEVLFLVTLGPQAFRQIAGPLLFLYFLVPFGEFLTPRLQDFTAAFTMHGLDLLGIPNFTDGLTIQIPEGNFVIAEACAGLRFLIASFAFGCLYALLLYRSPWRRLAFIAVSLVVPVIANGFRALGIVVLGHLLGSAQAAETDHVLYGWIFFSIVLLILVALGLPFREDLGAPPPPPAPPRRNQAFPAALAGTAAALVLLAVGPAGAASLGSGLRSGIRGLPIAAFAPCEPASLPQGAKERQFAQAFRCDSYRIVLRSEVFPAGTPSRPVLQELLRQTNMGREGAMTSRIARSGLTWQVTTMPDPPAMTAALLWTDGGPAQPGGLAFRIARAWRSLTGGGTPLVLLVASADEEYPFSALEWRRRASLGLETFLTSQGKPIMDALQRVAPRPAP